MRDVDRLHDRDEVRLDRVQVIWLTLGGVVALGLMFALGLIVGRRAALFEQPAEPADLIARADLGVDEHEKLNFYERLTEPTSKGLSTTPVIQAPAPPAPAAAAELAAGPPPAPPESNAEPAEEGSVRAALDSGPAQAGDFTIQVSAYQSMAEARAFSASLERRGFRPFVVQSTIRGKGTWYRVRMGRFTDQEMASLGKGLLAQADIAAWVLRTE